MDAFTVMELARHYGVSTGTIGRWCSEDKIKGYRDPFNGRRKRYPLNDVQESYNKRYGVAA